jgi:superfamily I DNA/RNA helicase
MQLNAEDTATFVSSVFDPERWIARECIEAETAKLDMELMRSTALDFLQESLETPPQLSTPEHLRSVAQKIRYSVATRQPFVTEGAADLKVATLWGAKGVTADHVYILGVCGEAIPGQRRDEYPGTDAEYVEEQKRLFYVSITRTRKTLVLSRSRRVPRGEALRLGLAIRQQDRHHVQLEMSPFMRDIIELLPGGVAGHDWRGCGG